MSKTPHTADRRKAYRISLTGKRIKLQNECLARILHFNHTNVLLDKLKNSTLLRLEGTGQDQTPPIIELHFDDWDSIIDRIAEHLTGN